MQTKTLILAALAFASPALAQRGGGGGQNPALASLKTVALPSPGNLDLYVRDETALIALGKALFWDVQAGSDGQTACATCHFHAGADHRLQNQLSGPDATLNYTLTTSDFPFHKLSDTSSNRSAITGDRNQVAGSMGVVARTFAQIDAGSAADDGDPGSFSPLFTPDGVHLRQVTARNTPSIINAVFNYRNFWDGRASNIFTGANPFGDSDKALNALVNVNGTLQRQAVRMDNSSLASQAAGPILNSTEMSWAGRDWPALGRKLFALTPLGRQKVSATDSVLGSMANPEGNGLTTSYSALMQASFRPEFYNSPDLTNGYTQAENNFNLFWALAIQAYERTLVANDSRADQFFEGRATALTALEQQGLNDFRNGASRCTNCHNGPELTAAGWTGVQSRAANLNTPANIGFFRIGVRPIGDDGGLGGIDGFNLPLFPASPAAAAGTFKTPGLRNVEFTGPYFHNGSQATLEQVLDFYGRNGDFPAGGNLGPGIGGIRLNAGDRTAIVAFLKALSDDRVRFQKAPFDHPSICVPNGHVETAPNQFQIEESLSGSVAVDKWALVPEVGREGSIAPLQTFEELLAGIGADGTRANTMNLTCKP